MKRLFVIPLVFLFLVGSVSADWGWTPDWDFFPDFDFNFPDACSVDADCGNSTSCTALSCQYNSLSASNRCAASYAPNGTYCGIPLHACDGAGNCVPSAPPVLDCNDNNACTTDFNFVTFCSHSPLTCDDSNPFTTDTCNPASGCVHTSICIAAPEICNGLDDDCDGQVDDGLTAPLSAYQQGVCAGNTMSCLGSMGWFDVPPLSQESCNGLDDDCDGQVDEGFDLGNSCSTCDGVYVCSGGVAVCSVIDPINYGSTCDGADADLCNEGTIGCNGLCSDSSSDTLEVCDNQVDDDCDGQTDEDCSVPVVCGDGIIDNTEACDDGNTNNNDGCSSVCLIEAEWMCTGNPSNCTPVEPECIGNTVIGGTIYKENVTNGISGASVEVICSHDGNPYTQTTTSISKGQYSVTFHCDECDYTDEVVVNAEKDALAGTNDGSVSMTYPGLTLNVGIVNVDLIPEFGIVAGTVALIGALGIFMYRRH